MDTQITINNLHICVFHSLCNNESEIHKITHWQFKSWTHYTLLICQQSIHLVDRCVKMSLIFVNF